MNYGVMTVPKTQYAVEGPAHGAKIIVAGGARNAVGVTKTNLAIKEPLSTPFWEYRKIMA